MAQPHFLQANQLYPDIVWCLLRLPGENGAAIALSQDLTNLDQRKMPADCGHFAMYDIDDIGCQNGFTFRPRWYTTKQLHHPELNLDNRMLSKRPRRLRFSYGEPIDPLP